MKNKKRSVLFLFFFIVANCSKIQVITPHGNDFYNKSFLDEIKVVKNLFKKGKKEDSISILKGMEKKEMSTAENAFRKNLMGVIYFSQADYHKAISLFKDALGLSSPDKGLISQINLNLASTFFKINDFNNSLIYLSSVDENILNLDEWRKFHHLKFIFAKKNNDQKQMLESLLFYLGGAKSIKEMRNSTFFTELDGLFFQLTSLDRETFLKNFESERENLAIPYLMLLNAQNELASGNKEKSLEFIHLIRKKFSENSELSSLTENLLAKLESSGKIQPLGIGVVLPLSGKRKKFAEDTLQGIDSAFRDYFQDFQNNHGSPVIHIRDSMGNGVVGANVVRELIENEGVSIVIGGLFSDEALKEYLEAKKRGTFFISLSPVFLTSTEKDHFLLEIPGSLESQVKRAFSQDVIKKYGSKVALLVPYDERGDSFVDASWSYSKINNVKIAAVQNYQKDSNDYRETIKNMLGLKFPRERKEEIQILSQFSVLQKKQGKNSKGLNLTPVIEFDWILTPAFPDEALRLLPTFKYFDAFGISFMGGPSWRSPNMLKLSSTEAINFIGNEMTDAFIEFRKNFFKKYKKWPGLVETMSYDAIKVAYQVLLKGQFQNRSDLERFVTNMPLIEGLEGNWHLEKNLWIKEMIPMRFQKEKVISVFQDENNNNEGELKDSIL